jgi:hypothetical protein
MVENYCILNNFLNENSFKSKLKFTREFGLAFDYYWKTLDECDLKILRSEVQDIEF